MVLNNQSSDQQEIINSVNSPSTEVQGIKSQKIISELIEIDHRIRPTTNISTKRLHLSFETKLPIRETSLFADKLLKEALGTGTTGEVNILKSKIKYEINVYRDFMYHIIDHLCLETTTTHDELNIIYGPVNLLDDEDMVIIYWEKQNVHP